MSGFTVVCSILAALVLIAKCLEPWAAGHWALEDEDLAEFEIRDVYQHREVNRDENK